MAAVATISGIDEDWLRERAPLLAWDIVAQIDKGEKLATELYGLTLDQWEWLRRSPHFQSMVQKTLGDLGGPAGTVEIAKRKAALAIEQAGVLNLAQIVGNDRLPAPARVAAYKELRETAGISSAGAAANPNAGTAGSGGPLVVIQMGVRGVMQVGTIVPPEQPAAIEGTGVRVE